MRLAHLLSGLALLVAILPAAAGTLAPTAKIQGFGPKAGGHYDPDLLSPKSVAFSPDGRTLYINALEAGKTLVYRYPSLQRQAVISHRFTAADAPLFQGQSTVLGYPLSREMPASTPNQFMGKPVEMAFSHGGKFLWVPYYRRSTDPRSAGPSAVAVIETQTHRIVRVIPTGPLPKFVAVSPDSRHVVVVQWGDNTLLRLDTSGTDPRQWTVAQHWVVEKALDVRNVGANRDQQCGYCLRGAVFTHDGKHLIVARMGGGGLAGFEVATGRYLGSIRAVAPTPRHLVLSKDGQTLWMTSNVSGVLTRMSVPTLLASLQSAQGRMLQGERGEELNVGGGARTVSVSSDERFAYVATNTARKIVTVDLKAWKVVDATAASPFPVGLAVSPDGCTVASTSQGRAGQGGGNTVDLYSACPAH